MLPMFLFAQNEDDALRYSYYNNIGTARFASMGGAMGALGADFGALNSNPASIGLYRRSEITVTPNIYLDFSGGQFNGTSVADSKLNFNLSNIAGVFTSVNESLEDKLKGKKLSTRERKKIRGWMSSSFALGLIRTGSFHQNMVIQGTNPQSSLTDVFAANSQGSLPENLNPFAEGLAYNAYLTDTVNGNPTQYIGYVPNGGTLQRLSNQQKGSLSEFIFTYGANYNHKWYFGGTIGVPRVRYTSQSVYTESNVSDTISPVEGFVFDSLTYTQNRVAKGSGINLKLGTIYRVNDRLRIGFAFHTPSFLRITENYETTLRSRFNVGSFGPISSPLGQVTYNQLTPLRAIISMAYIFEKKGLISAEYELVPYGMSKLTSNIYDFTDVNEAIRAKYTTTGNVRVGAELRLSDRVALRGGFAYLGNPFKSILGNTRTAYNASLGLGYRKDGFFMDFAYVLGYRTEKYYMYDSAFTAPATITTTTHNVLATFGLRF